MLRASPNHKPLSPPVYFLANHMHRRQSEIVQLFAKDVLRVGRVSKTDFSFLKSSDQTQDPRCQQHQLWWKELRGIWAACKTSRSLPWKKMKWNVPVETRAFSIVCQRWHVAGINVARHGKLIVEEREGAVCLSAFRALVRQGALSQSSLHALEWCSPNFRLPPLQRLQT